MASTLCGLSCRGYVATAVIACLDGLLVASIPVTTVCSNKINSLLQVPPLPPSPLYRCLRFHAGAPELLGFEEDFTVAPLDPSPGWADLLPGADAHPFLNLASLAASTFTSTKQPQIRLTKTFSKQLCIRWRLDILASPVDLDMEFVL
jgi:hypothetical protein